MAPSIERSSTARGFTLLELLATLAIIAILAAVAIPSYVAYLTRAKRAEARADLLIAAALLERNHSTNGCYNYATPAACRAQAGAAPALPAASPAAGRAHHAIAVDYSGSATGQAYTLTATPCAAAGSCPAGSESHADADCGVLGLSHTGVRSSTGSTSAEVCWRR